MFGILRSTLLSEGKTVCDGEMIGDLNVRLRGLDLVGWANLILQQVDMLESHVLGSIICQ